MEPLSKLDFVPGPVMQAADGIAEHTGIEPVISRQAAPLRYRLTVTTDRVEMTLDYKLTSGRNWVWAGSTLHVDGKRVPLMSDAWAFYRLVKDPDSGGRRKATLPLLEPFPLDDPPEDVPAEQALFLRAVRDRAAVDQRLTGKTVTVGRADGTAVVEIGTETGTRVQLSVQPKGIGLRAVNDKGYEVTNELDGELRDALEALFRERGVPRPVEHGSPGARHEHRTERANSVEVRRQTVIRT